MKAGKTGFSTFGDLNSFSECQTPSAFLSLVSKGMIVIVAVAVLDLISRSALNMPISSLQGLEILVDSGAVHCHGSDRKFVKLCAFHYESSPGISPQCAPFELTRPKRV